MFHPFFGGAFLMIPSSKLKQLPSPLPATNLPASGWMNACCAKRTRPTTSESESMSFHDWTSKWFTNWKMWRSHQMSIKSNVTCNYVVFCWMFCLFRLRIINPKIKIQKVGSHDLLLNKTWIEKPSRIPVFKKSQLDTRPKMAKWRNELPVNHQNFGHLGPFLCCRFGEVL